MHPLWQPQGSRSAQLLYRRTQLRTAAAESQQRGVACASGQCLSVECSLHCRLFPFPLLLKAGHTHLGTTVSGTSQRATPAGLILTCSRLGVSGVTWTVSCLKLSPYSGRWSVTSARSTSVCSSPVVLAGPVLYVGHRTSSAPAQQRCSKKTRADDQGPEGACCSSCRGAGWTGSL